MACAIAVRLNFSATELRRLARHSKDGAQARRLLALAAIYDGGTRLDAARLGIVTLQIVRDWVARFNAEGQDGGLIDRKAPSPTPLLSEAQRQALAVQIDRGPIPAIHGVVPWRLCDLGQWLWEEFRVSVSMQTLSREVRALGYDNALVESINGLYKAEVIHRCGPWRSLEAAETATLEWVDWFNHRRLLELIGNIPPAEAEVLYHAT